MVVDIIEIRRVGFLGKTEFHRIKFDENYDSELIPQKGTLVYIDGNAWKVSNLLYYPYGDVNEKKGVKIYVTND